MKKFRFKADVVVEANTEEEALIRIGDRIATVARHLSNGRSLSANEPFFTLTETDSEVEAENINHDPIRAPALAPGETGIPGRIEVQVHRSQDK